MARTTKNNFSQTDVESGVVLLDELISLVRNDGHCLSLAARKKLIDLIEKSFPKNSGVSTPEQSK